MNPKYTKLKIASIALMSLFSFNAFAVGVSTSESELETPTLTSLAGERISYKDAEGKDDIIRFSASLASGYTLTAIENPTGEYITKYLDNGDGTYTAKYYQLTYNSNTTTLVQDSDGNYIENAISNGSEYGGSIYNYKDTIDLITGDFIENSASYGGAIANDEGRLDLIVGDFIKNSASYGGAIYNNYSSTIGTIIGDFIENTVNMYGGAIYNLNSTINTITGDFIGNWADESGGAIYNELSTIDTITGNFVKNSVRYAGGAIYNLDSTISTITGDFIENSAIYSSSDSLCGGGAIFNYNSTIGTITGDFIKNSASYGGAIYNDYSSTIGTITGDFIGNSASYGGAIYNDATIGAITGDFIGNSASAYGGAIYVYYTGTTTFLALDDDITFTGNYVGSDGNYTSNAIYNDGATINFNVYDGHSIVVNDGISGYDDYVDFQILNINSTNNDSATSYGTVEFNNTVEYQTVNVYAGTLKLGSYEGGYVNEEYTAEASSANLSNSILNVKDGATLSIATGVSVSNSSAITLEDGATLSIATSVSVSNSSTITLGDGATLLFEAAANLTLDASSSISIGDLEAIIVEISNFEVGTWTIDLICTDSADTDTNATAANAISNALLDCDITLLYSTNSNISISDVYISTNGSTVVLNYTVATASVPEPSTYAMIIGILAIGFAAYRRRK